MTLKMNKNKTSGLFYAQFQLLGHNGPIYALSQDGDHLYSASSDKLIVRWNIPDGTQDHFVVKTDRPAFSILKSQITQELIIGLDDGSIHVIDTERKKEIKHLKAHLHAVFTLAEHPQNGQRYSADAAGNLFVWDAQWHLLLKIPLGCGKIRDIKFSTNSQFIFLACGDGKIKMLDCEFFNELNDWTAHQEACTALCLLPDATILSGGKDAYIRHWDTNGVLLKSFPAHKGTIYGLALLDSKQYVSVSRDKSIKIWDLSSHQIAQKIEMSGRTHLHSINVVLSRGEQFITAGDDKRIIVWSQTP